MGKITIFARMSVEPENVPALEALAERGCRAVLGSLMALIGSMEFYVLCEPTAEHAAMLSAVPGAQFDAELASK